MKQWSRDSNPHLSHLEVNFCPPLCIYIVDMCAGVCGCVCVCVCVSACACMRVHIVDTHSHFHPSE